ncbi:MAG: PorT family protein [Bacteroidales bacterium]|nr:PorT family protein [Bacteroidales bacterium]
MIKKKSMMGIMVTFALIAMSFQAYSQYGRSEIKVGFTSGLNLNNIKQDYVNTEDEELNKMSAGFRIGATVDYSFNDAVSLQSGLLFTTKGFGIDLEKQYQETIAQQPGVDNVTVDVDGYSRVTYNYLEIPVNIAYKSEELQVFAGPYLAINIGGKRKTDATVTTEYEIMGTTMDNTDKQENKTKLKPAFGKADLDNYGENESPVNGIDYGFNFGVGFDFEPLLINVGYSLGLGNLTADLDVDGYDPADYKTSNRVIYFSVSYFLDL